MVMPPSLNSLPPPNEQGASFSTTLPAGKYTLAVSAENSACGTYALRIGITPEPTTDVTLSVSSARADAGTAGTASSQGGGTQSKCTCLAEWSFHGETYYGCDARKPTFAGAWCPVAQQDCGRHMRRSERLHVRIDGSTVDSVWYDWCTPATATAPISLAAELQPARLGAAGSQRMLAGAAALAAACAAVALLAKRLGHSRLAAASARRAPRVNDASILL
ncbi:hypothetical protein T492DRAFT_846712 [Pavlovales sp. CCMP2436]|nr:hypothetical protein T492DRAFT_846712 [Pavlovales sp. CCMP2436]